MSTKLYDRVMALASIAEDVADELHAIAVVISQPGEPKPPPEPPVEPPKEPPEEPKEPPVEEPEEPAEPPDVPPTIPPVPPSPDIPPTPSNLPVILSRVFDHKPTAQELRADGWDSFELKADPDAAYVTDPLGSGRTVLRVHTPLMPKGGTGTIPQIQTLGLSPVKEILVESEMMTDEDFEGEGTGENKRWWVGTVPSNNSVFLTLRCRGTGPVIPAIKLQGSCDPRGEVSPEGLVRSPAPILRGKKYRYGIYLKANDKAAPMGQKSNGIMALLIDGVVVDQLNDVNFTRKAAPTVDPQFGHCQFSNTYGGGMKVTRAFNDFIYDVLVRGR